MVNAPLRSSPSPGSTLTRALCLVVLVLIGVASAYGVFIAARNVGQIGV
jgi:hypothetical protein